MFMLQNPSFHLSIAWAVGDQKEALEKILPTLENTFQTHITSSPELAYLEVTQYVCKSGNKMFAFELK